VVERPGAKEGGGREAYRAAGVDIEAGERAVALMRDAVASTRRPEVVGGLGGFAGAIEIPAGYRRPLLVASTDGVGTKVALARRAGRLEGLGIDLVAMCADDVACAGAEPLFLLDYVAVGHVVPEWVAELVGSGRGRVSRGRLRARGRRDRRAPGPDGGRRVRPVGVLHRRRRAGRRNRWERGQSG
jgi:hypothetical protein